MRDVLLFLFIIALVPFCAYRPWIGILAWSWLGYMNPHRLTWGFAFDFPFAQVVGIATLCGFGWYAIRVRGLSGILAGAELKLLLLLWIIFTLTTFPALVPDDAWQSWNQITKILLMTFLTAFLIDDEKKLWYLMMVITASIGFYGLKGSVFSIMTGGNYRVWGPPGSFFEDNNALALVLNMTLPFMFFLAQIEHRKWLRNGLYGLFGMTILAVLFTYSRGGFVGLVVVLFGIFLTFKLRWKLPLIVLGLVAAPVVISQLPEALKERILTIQSYDEDGSALSRLEAWRAAWGLALDRPLTGGGFEALNDSAVYLQYNPEILTKAQTPEAAGLHISGVHSVYFELLAENGFPGLIVFLILVLLIMLSLRRIRRVPKSDATLKRIAYGRMLTISLFAYLICGTFLEMASFDLFYQLIAIVVVVKRIYAEPVEHRSARGGRLVPDSNAAIAYAPGAVP